ncbi:F-box only protein 24-like [Hoplias malabaricus]|uniref:F-box only protein 24-like n=1 Tax=Hoplias malabaricus TaxID=27720 RepID=UPI003462742D
MKRKHKLHHVEQQCRNFTAPPILKKRRTETPPDLKETPAISILSLPPEVLENILCRLPVSDVISLGSTCHYLYETSLSRLLWKNLYFQNVTSPVPSNNDKTNWRRLTILKMSQGLVLQRLNSGVRSHCRQNHLTITQTLNTPMALGFRRVMPILNYTLLWDYNGTIFVFHTLTGNWTFMRPFGTDHCSVLCYHAKDFAVDPRSNPIHRKFIYVLVRQEISSNPPEGTGPQTCDYMDVYHWNTHERVRRFSFDPSLSFTQIRLTGLENKRTILLLNDDGQVYSMSLNENELNISRNYSTQLKLKSISQQLPDHPIKQIHTSLNSILYVTDNGSVFTEVHTRTVFHNMFGSYAGYDQSDVQTFFPVMLTHKVVKCSLGLMHLCLLDNHGRLFMQGSNRYGQLGTGDKIDRGEPTMVLVSMAPVDVWCGLNHTLVLMETQSGDKQVQSCGCGSRGRLPGCPEGSPVFVTLNIEAPRTATSLCSSRECLYLICSHDVDEPPAIRYIPPGVEDEDHERQQDEEIQQLHSYLCLLDRYDSTKMQIATLQTAINQHLTGLSGLHRAFLDTALTIVLQTSTTAAQQLSNE